MVSRTVYLTFLLMNDVSVHLSYVYKQESGFKWIVWNCGSFSTVMSVLLQRVKGTLWAPLAFYGVSQSAWSSFAL